MVRRGYLPRFFMVLLFSFILFNHGQAQPSPDDESGTDGGSTTDDLDDPGNTGPDPDLPIDSNILVLVAAGVGYGLKKRYEIKQALKRKKSTKQESAPVYQNL